VSGRAETGRAGDANVINVRTAFDSPWLTVREAVVRAGTDLTRWYYVDHPGCALVLPVTTDGRVALIRVWRIAVRRWCREAPAGRIDPREKPADAARRELAEEIGGECTAMRRLGEVFSSSGTSNERVHLFVAHGVWLGRRRPDRHERIELDLMAPARAVELARAGQVEDAPSALAILWAHGLGLLDGREVS
jgi:ADP-ribose pyrophosphatase